MLIDTIFILIILLLSVVIHEVSHGSVANSLGDPTAKYAGRLSLNPLKHLDLVGSFLVPAMLLLLTQGRGPVVGWAKPVPVNPYNFRDPKKDMAKVAAAGPASNFAIALVFGLGLRFLPLSATLFSFFSIIVFLNLLLAIFNLIPVPPLDGSNILFAFLPDRYQGIKIILQQSGLFILIFFIFFAFPLMLPVVEGLYSLIVGVPFL